MRNLSLMFAILSFTILVFGIIAFFVTKDRQILQIAGIGTVLFILSSTFVNALSIPSEESKINSDNARNSEYDTLWRRLDENERESIDHLNRIQTNFDNRLDDIWNTVYTLKESGLHKKK